VVDSSISERDYPGDERYYIVYEQEYKNENIFILFDELKPGWIAPTTLPHSLATAMFNITRPYWPNIVKITIVDPFGGSGTTYLESIKYGNKIDFYSSDLNFIYEIVVKDNLRFFSLDEDELKAFIEFADKFMISDECNNIYGKPSSPPFQKEQKKIYPTEGEAELNPYAWITILFENETERYRGRKDYQTLREIYSHKFTDDFKQHFYKDASFFYGRILFYLMWRATLRNLYSLSHVDMVIKMIKEAIETEINIFKNAIKTEFFPRKEKPEAEQVHDRFVLQKKLLATECTIDPNAIKEGFDKVCGGNQIETKDAIDALNEKQGVNVIITDPPYGFNTNVQSANEFADLYKNMIQTMIKSLSNEGQIVCCLPSTSRNGQNIAAFTTKEFVINSIFSAARENNSEIIQPAFVHPNPSSLFEPPYYWESAKALRRTICHFIILKDPNIKGERKDASVKVGEKEKQVAGATC
jgi:16S rRNA G966 N2-methylase RsmD